MFSMRTVFLSQQNLQCIFLLAFITTFHLYVWHRGSKAAGKVKLVKKSELLHETRELLFHQLQRRIEYAEKPELDLSGEKIKYIDSRPTTEIPISKLSKLEISRRMSREFNIRRKYGRAAPVLNVEEAIFKMYDLNKASNDKSKCVPFRATPPFDICIHDVEEDAWISGSILQTGLWEVNLVSLFTRTLRKNPGFGVIDIGANLGIYSLIAASLDRSVISVEPLGYNIAPLHKSVKVNGFEDRISLVTNAVSNTRERVYFKEHKGNRGGTSMWEGKVYCKDKDCPSADSIFIDDLVPLAEARNMNKAIMKIDIEGAEHLAFAEASRFLRAVYVPVIFIEMSAQRLFCGKRVPESDDKYLVDLMFELFKSEGYTRVYESNGSVWPMPLDPENCNQDWPRDVVWVKTRHVFP